MSRTKFVYDDPWEPEEHKGLVPKATEKQKAYLRDLFEIVGLPQGVDMKTINIREASDLIKKLDAEKRELGGWDA